MAIQAVDQAAGDIVRLARTDPMHYTADGLLGALGDADEEPSFEEAMLKALDGVSDLQQESSTLAQRMIVDPDSVDPHDVTIAMAEASLSLNITRTVLDRVVRAWKDLINTR